MSVSSVRLLMHPGSSNEYIVTVPTAPTAPTAPYNYTAPTNTRNLVPYTRPLPSMASVVPATRNMTYRAAPGDRDNWTLKVPDANGDGYHRWEYKHVHEGVCQCRDCLRERELFEREREMEREREARLREMQRQRAGRAHVVGAILGREPRYW